MNLRIFKRFLIWPVLLGCFSVTAWNQASFSSQAPAVPADYNFRLENERAAKLDLDRVDPVELRRIFDARRKRVLRSIPEGAMLVFSVEEPQPRRLEFQVPHSENHDFIYLTGIEAFDSVDSAILLLPTPEKDWVVLYTAGDPKFIQEMSGIEDVRPFSKLEEDFSVALTDYRDWRNTQRLGKPLPGALAKKWGADQKVIYLNYPRFLRLGMQEPVRLDFFEKLKRFSPEIKIQDSADILDHVRMFQDAYDLASLRRAIQITAEGMIEAFRSCRPGMTENQVNEVIDFVFRYRGAYMGFPTNARAFPIRGQREVRGLPEGWIQFNNFVPRASAPALVSGALVHVDAGAAFNHHSADVQRTIPMDGKFTPEQSRVYDVGLNVQKTVISKIRPGVTWSELSNLIGTMLRDAGYGQSFTGAPGHLIGVMGHFLGMEVHDEGDYDQPLRAGMVLAIEQGARMPNGPSFSFEDDILVTEDGHEWLTRFIPIERSEVEAMMTSPGSFVPFVKKAALSIAPEVVPKEKLTRSEK